MKNAAKPIYHIRNWNEYDIALKQRGSLTVWISPEALRHWTSKERTGLRGASPTYTDLAIETMATLQALYGLAGRQTEGFVASIFALMQLQLAVPDHSTLSRRRGQVRVPLPVHPAQRARHVVVDPRGVKVYGAGEWKVRQHGWSKRRTWRKLHLCVDEATHEILSARATTAHVSDGAMLAVLLTEVPGKIAQVSGDGSYDKRKCYDAIGHYQARAAIPPRKDARIWQHGNRKASPPLRDENLRQIRQGGRTAWKRHSGYHRRSLAETAFFRFKTIFGERLQTRNIANQFSEMLLKCVVLNHMTHLGLPDSYKVGA